MIFCNQSAFKWHYDFVHLGTSVDSFYILYLDKRALKMSNTWNTLLGSSDIHCSYVNVSTTLTNNIS